MDNPVFGTSLHEHMDNLKVIFERLKENPIG